MRKTTFLSITGRSPRSRSRSTRFWNRSCIFSGLFIAIFRRPVFGLYCLRLASANYRQTSSHLGRYSWLISFWRGSYWRIKLFLAIWCRFRGRRWSKEGSPRYFFGCSLCFWWRILFGITIFRRWVTTFCRWFSIWPGELVSCLFSCTILWGWYLGLCSWMWIWYRNCLWSGPWPVRFIRLPRASRFVIHWFCCPHG